MVKFAFKLVAFLIGIVLVIILITVQNIIENSGITNDKKIISAIEILKDIPDANILLESINGKNPTKKPIKIMFKDLSSINPLYSNYDSLAWKKRKHLYIYINNKHKDAPKEALAALAAPPAIHTDNEDSLNEEIYARTKEAVIWSNLLEKNPNLANISHPLVKRENLIKKLFDLGKIDQAIVANKNYSFLNLPQESAGYLDNDETMVYVRKITQENRKKFKEFNKKITQTRN